MIDFLILGAGGALPTRTHTPAAYWVTVDRVPILVDPGPGALVRLVKSSGGPPGVDGIERVALTHLHPDHTGDLVALLFALHSPLTASTEDLQLFGPPGTRSFLDQLAVIYGRWIEPRKRKLVVREIRPGQGFDLPGGGLVRSFEVDHPQDRLSELCLGYTFKDAEGHRAVFSGDTGSCPGLTTAARGADLLVIECSAPDGLGVAGHLTPAEVGTICNDARPVEVVLTHQYPAAADSDLVAAVGKVFDGRVHQARDGYRIQVPGGLQDRTINEPHDRGAAS